jgi:hypothetical protein
MRGGGCEGRVFALRAGQEDALRDLRGVERGTSQRGLGAGHIGLEARRCGVGVHCHSSEVAGLGKEKAGSGDQAAIRQQKRQRSIAKGVAARI